MFSGFVSSLRRLPGDMLRLFLPQCCCVCHLRLSEGEQFLCTACYAALPFTRLHGKRGNSVERLFWGKIPIVRANAFIKYLPGSYSRTPFFLLKYYGRPEVGRYFGRIMSTELVGTDFFDGITLILPVPLARKKLRQRGYNQSEWLARGVAEVTGLSIETEAVERVHANPSQTHLNTWQRQENVDGIFVLRHPERLAGRHVLLVDDILTTGSTLLSCALEVAKAPDVRISVLVMGLAGHHPDCIVPRKPQDHDGEKV